MTSQLRRLRFASTTTSLLFVAAFFTVPAVTMAQGVLPPNTEQSAELAAGATHKWTVELGAGQSAEVHAVGPGDLALMIYAPSGVLVSEVDWAMEGQLETDFWMADQAGMWTVVVSEADGDVASYSIHWTLYQGMQESGQAADADFGAGAFGDDPFGDEAFGSDLYGNDRVVLPLDENVDHESTYQIYHERWADLAEGSPNRNIEEPILKVFTAHPFVGWRDGLWIWLKSLWRRERRWKDHAERILGFLATAPDHGGAVAIPVANEVL